MRFFTAALIVLASFSAPVLAQSADEFEVAALRPSAPDAPFNARLDASQFICTHHSLMIFIMSAYPDIEIQPWKVNGGPAWLNTEYWDLSAKLPPGMPTEQQPLYRKTEQMLRTFLADRFSLKVHRETREQPVYALVIGKNGSKLKDAATEQTRVKALATGGFEFRHISMSVLVSYLYSKWSSRQAADRPVIDMTGLDGFYDFTLEWTPDDAPQVGTANGGPSMYTAVEQQLGLKLQPQKAPLDFLVIDHAERPDVN